MTEHDAGTNVILFLCNMRFLHWVTWLEGSPLPWLNLSWNCITVWDYYNSPFLLFPLCFQEVRSLFLSKGSYCLFLPSPPLCFTSVTLSCTSNSILASLSLRIQTHKDHYFYTMSQSKIKATSGLWINFKWWKSSAGPKVKKKLKDFLSGSQISHKTSWYFLLFKFILN